ncbi:MAG: alpha-glucan family phosphorylase [Gammaproteobacteria bacterium]|nr:MAG: alpha-glucan family phosphorylase [Gammaproteobacteria bacterium]
MEKRAYGVRPDLPEALEPLSTLALDLRWSWSHVADRLWRRIDEPLWQRTRNPWLILQTVSRRRLETLAIDGEFLALLAALCEEQQAASRGETWFERHHGDADLPPVAYFCMEYGLTEALPLYSGGLGVLAGDHLKTCSELGVPLVAVGLLYQQGYFRQGIDPQGNQIAYYPFNDPTQLPILPVRDEEGEWLHVELELPGRTLRLRTWEARVGRISLYLLDSNDPLNDPADRGITSELYGGGPELRLQQEMVLGIGGWRLLEALDLAPSVCHLNEGHAAFVVLERARSLAAREGLDFSTALVATRAGNLFTTHTPVDAGFDRYAPGLVREYLGAWCAHAGIAPEVVLALGRTDPNDAEEPFNMAWLAIRGSGKVNGVSRLHGAVSRRLFQSLFPRWPRYEVPVGHVTNGVHVPSWDSPASDRLWTEACGKDRWRMPPDHMIEAIRALADAELWEMRTRNRKHLIERLRRRPVALRPAGRETHDLLDPNLLTIGFARRFASYKRPNLLLHDPDRLERLLRHPERPVQLVIAGKAHPKDLEGQAMIRDWVHFIRERDLFDRVVFLIDYDLMLADDLVQGVDLWLNTPRRPWEACGTSGMKVLVNGGLNCSELDGWWAEAWRPEVGWALGDGREHGADPAWDALEAERLYTLLEEEVVPAFYTRNAQGIPEAWLARVRESMASLTPRFSSNRMVREYLEACYLPLHARVQARAREGAARARRLSRCMRHLQAHWGRLHFGNVELSNADGKILARIQAYLDDIDPDLVCVELYADPLEGEVPERHVLERRESLAGAVNGYLYVTEFASARPVEHYTARILPACEGMEIPLELPLVAWQR